MTAQSKPIRGKIAKVINSREVALNIGAAHGVESGMLFEILDDGGSEVRDPDTGELLGLAERSKIKVLITRTYDKFAVAHTYRRKEVNVGGRGALLGEYPKWEIHYETLKSQGGFERAVEDLDEKGSRVAIGDPAVQVVVPERQVGSVDPLLP